ncbi:MAG: ABC transporter substrate-binding protein [Thermoleophilaceae bacterium]|nr:ABC transporter substrate-binding protein [Thermoleophilaceae bacterium]
MNWRSQIWRIALVSVTVASLTAVLAGCGKDARPVARIYLGIPTTGPLAARGRDMERAVRMAIEQTHGDSGDHQIELSVINTGASDNLTAAARAATADGNAVALIGGLTYGSALNATAVTRGHQLLQVSPGQSSGLSRQRYGTPLPSGTAANFNFAEWNAQPNNLISVAPSQYKQGQAIVQESAAQGLRHVSSFTPSKVVLTGIQDEAKTAGLPIVRAPSSIVADDLLASKVPQYGRIKTLITPALAYDDLPPGGQRFVDQFEDQYGEPPDRFAIFAYDAAGLALEAIDKAGLGQVTPATVNGAAFAVRNRFGPTGHYDVRADGSTTLFTLGARYLPLSTRDSNESYANDKVVEVTR